LVEAKKLLPDLSETVFGIKSILGEASVFPKPEEKS